MNCSPLHPRLSQYVLTLVAPFTLFGFALTINADSTNEGAPQVECITPDGRVLPLLNGESNPTGAWQNDGTIHCPLPEGETVFIIALPRAGALGRVRLINENATASGELKIAVANSRLPAGSPAWTNVDGTIPFVCKRLFNLSILGVEARYVRLSFRVDTPATFKGISIDPRALQQAAALAAN